MRFRYALFLPLVLAAQTVAPPPDARDQVDRIFARFDNLTGPGCAVGVSLAGEPVLSAGYGMADLEHSVPITPDTVFEPGSVTKQFTAAAVLLLAQQGKLSLDDPARKYIPDLPDYGTPITIRHLLNHTAGCAIGAASLPSPAGRGPRASTRTLTCWKSSPGRSR